MRSPSSRRAIARAVCHNAGRDAQPPDRQPDQSDDLSFEVTDLTTGASQPHPLTTPPADERVPQLTARTSGAQRTQLLRVSRGPLRVVVTLDARALRIGLAAVTLLLVAGVVLGNLPRLTPGWFSSAPLSSPTPHDVGQSDTTYGITVDPSQPTAYPTPTVPAPFLGAIPQSCSPGPTVSSPGAPGIGTALGYEPVWVGAFDGPSATLSILTHGSHQFTQYGWQVDIELVFTEGYGAPVTLSGSDVTTNSALWFSAQNPLADHGGVGSVPTTTFTTDVLKAQANGAAIHGARVFYPLSMYLPGAGCYRLSASWPGASWQYIFAAGA